MMNRWLKQRLRLAALVGLAAGVTVPLAAGVTVPVLAEESGHRPVATQPTAMSEAPILPAAWQSEWDKPSVQMRPLEILHRLDDQIASRQGLAKLKAGGLGGIVTNVHWNDYLKSEDHWTRLETTLEHCRALGLRVWIYDEQGYPSGAAGGQVLADHPEYEALALTYDPDREEPFAVRPAYEHTHASNNFYVARRYPNLINQEAVARFIELTHDAYRRRVGEYLGNPIEATFTDEPSLIAVNIGQLSENIRQRVPKLDAVDETIMPLASVPWAEDLPELYRQRYDQDLLAHRRSLFVGETDSDKQVRWRFWRLISVLLSQRYFGQLQDWCQRAGISSSGHSLAEESILSQVPLEGSGLKMLGRMDIPGLDVLDSDPQVLLFHRHWLTATLPVSAALHHGGRRVMTETSGLVQRFQNKVISLPAMQATAAWQAAFGVTEFMLYYHGYGAFLNAAPDSMEYEKYSQYCDYVGRCNSILRPGRPDPDVLLFYPIEDLWAEYLPTAEPISLEKQSQRAQILVNSFNTLGHELMTRQIPFSLIDTETFERADVTESGLAIHDNRYRTIIFPEGTGLSNDNMLKLAAFCERGGRTIGDVSRRSFHDGMLAQSKPNLDQEKGVVEQLAELTDERPHLIPATEKMVLGQFKRDGRRILVLVNLDTAAYDGILVTPGYSRWLAADPATGQVVRAVRDSQGFSIRLDSWSATIFIEDKSESALEE